MKFLIAIILLLSTSLNLLGQDEMLENIDFENAIQKLLPQQEFDVDYNDIYDRLFTLYTTPLDLNHATRSELQSLYILSDEQIEGILKYRENYGDFKSIYELITIKGFNTEIVKKIYKFISIPDRYNVSFAEALKRPAIHELFLRYQSVLEPKKGYSSPDTLSNGSLSSRYVGDPGRLYARYLLAKPGRFSFGFTTEKDPGEKLTWDPETRRFGMDYYSFHAMFEKVWVFDKIIVGDYNLDFGQGLVFGSGISIGKGTQPVTTIRRNNLGLRPYRSVFEGKDFSGLAISVKSGHLNANIFLSHVYRDARRLKSEFSDETQDSFISNIS